MKTTPEERLRVNVRDVAVQAERSWWVRKLQDRIDELEPIARTTTNIGHFAQIERELLADIITSRIP